MALRQTAGFWPVAAAIGGNATVTVIKFMAATVSGSSSSSMLSEAVHSFADTLNQIQQRSLRDEFEEVKNDYEAFKRFCVDYTDRIPRLIGLKIDDIEARLKERFSSIRHIDIELN